MGRPPPAGVRRRERLRGTRYADRMSEIRGVLTAMVTPFDADGAVDLDAARRLARHLVDNGSHGARRRRAPPASRRRSPTTRSCALLDAVLDEVGDEATVIAGTGSNDTRHTVELTRKAARRRRPRGARRDAVLQQAQRAGLRAHFAAVSEAAGETPVVLYNIPSRSRDQHAARAARRARRRARERRRRQAGQQRRARADRGPRRSSPATTTSSPARSRFGGAGGILVASHVVGAADARALRRRGRRRRASAPPRSTPS